VKRTGVPERAAELVRWHHERLDGSGYPDGLKGDQIPLLVRIISVADVAVALRTNRPHRPAWERQKVLDFLQLSAGRSLDERVVQAHSELSGD